MVPTHFRVFVPLPFMYTRAYFKLEQRVCMYYASPIEHVKAM